MAGIGPVTVFSVGEPGAFHVLRRGRLDRVACGFIVLVPQAVHRIVLCQHFDQFVFCAGYDIQNARGKIGSLEYLIEVGRGKRMRLGGYGDYGVSHRDRRCDRRAVWH